jgi:uncharacterized protein involved in oxidation of intracellular sulfur
LCYTTSEEVYPMATKAAFICNGPEASNVFPCFVLGASSAALGNEVVVFFTPAGSPALGKGVMEEMHVNGLPPLVELVEDFLGLGGKIMLCELAFPVKGLTEDDIRDGVEVVGAVGFMDEIQDATLTFSF